MAIECAMFDFPTPGGIVQLGLRYVYKTCDGLFPAHIRYELGLGTPSLGIPGSTYCVHVRDPVSDFPYTRNKAALLKGIAHLRTGTYREIMTCDVWA